MNNYLDSLTEEIRKYFKILSPEFPEWLFEYINTPEMQRISGISMNCGTDYTKVFNIKKWYSNLDHSIGVALIIWHFTHDKKQTLSGLFHDIATPTFKHCIDFMNGDAENQESTEERTELIIKNSKQIMSLLKRDHINLEEVSDYHIYPIADNDTPKLSADRFEYTFSSGLNFFRVWNLNDIRECYNNVKILKNEDNILELGFTDKTICEKYIDIVSKLWPQWLTDEDRTAMQFLADTVKSMNVIGKISIDDLYKYSEKEIINKILNCGDKYIETAFKNFQNATSIERFDSPQSDKYCINIKGKKRYVIPLVETDSGTFRINSVSEKSKNAIDEYFKYKQTEYTGFNFDFKPQNNKTIDSEKLEKGVYKLAIVFSSSAGGAKFEGAVGSTLYVDQVEIVNE